MAGASLNDDRDALALTDVDTAFSLSAYCSVANEHLLLSAGEE